MKVLLFGEPGPSVELLCNKGTTRLDTGCGTQAKCGWWSDEAGAGPSVDPGGECEKSGCQVESMTEQDGLSFPSSQFSIIES